MRSENRGPLISGLSCLDCGWSCDYEDPRDGAKVARRHVNGNPGHTVHTEQVVEITWSSPAPESNQGGAS